MAEDTQQESSEIADLDAFVPRNTKTIKYKGKQHVVTDLLNLPYDAFLRVSNLAYLLKGLSSEKQFDLMLQVVSDCVPSLHESISSMEMSRLGVLIALIRGAYARGQESADPLSARPSA